MAEFEATVFVSAGLAGMTGAEDFETGSGSLVWLWANVGGGDALVAESILNRAFALLDKAPAHMKATGFKAMGTLCLELCKYKTWINGIYMVAGSVWL